MTKTTASDTASAKPLFDPASMFSSFAMPNFDIDAMAANQRRNVEALTEANKLACDSARDFATRQAEIMKSTIDAYADTMRSLMTVSDPATRVTKQAELAKSTIETTNANLRNLADLAEFAKKAQAKSLDVINKRVVESIDEFQALAAKA